MPRRIAVGGVQHETNTFAEAPASFTDFEQADGWPGLSRGAALEPAVYGANLPAAGFISACRSGGQEIAPLVWCSASPSGPATDDAFERIAAMLLEDLALAGKVDAVYLDLHGAMVTETLEDGEGELLRRVRGLIGPDIPLVASIDLHANVSKTMVEQATALVGYRTYPHIDMAETGKRAMHLLDRILREGPPAKAFRQGSYLIPLPSQCTLLEPARGIYDYADTVCARDAWSGSVALGFPAADVADCGPSVTVYAATPEAAATAADRIASRIAASESAFSLDMLSPDAAVREALVLAARCGRPVILADTQDNPGGGAASDGVALIESLLAHQARNAVVGLLYDPAAARAAHAAGRGAAIALDLGAGSRWQGAQPVRGSFLVERLGDGRFTGTGPFYGGNRMDLGPMALLRVGEVRIAVSSRRQQAADQAMFRHLGVEPAETAILGLKSSVHFRADFGPIAQKILLVEAPGANLADPSRLRFRRLRAGVRLRPQGAHG